MRDYYLEMEVIIKIHLLGVMLINKKVYIPIPPIDKGIEETTELLVEKIFHCKDEIVLNPYIQDLRLELLMKVDTIRSNYEMQIIPKGVTWPSKLPDFENCIKYRMIKLEYELKRRLTTISTHLYGKLDKL